MRRGGRRGDGREWLSALPPIAVASIPLMVQVAMLARALRWRGPGGSDYAGLELDVRTALHGHLLLGASSRLGVRNLGPIHAYWTAPWYALTGEGMGGMVLAAWLAELAAVVGVVLTVRSVVSPRAAWFAAVAIALAWLRAGPTALSDFYNPALTMPAVLTATIAAAALSRGHWRALPVLIAAASFGAQLHFAAAPGLLLVALVGVGAGCRTSSRPDRRVLMACGALVVLLWAPTAIDQVHGTGNVSRLVSAITKGAESADQPLGLPPRSGQRGERAETAIELIAATAPNAATFGTLPGEYDAAQYIRGQAQSGPTPLRTTTAMVLVGAALVAAGLNRRRAPFGAAIISLAFLGATITYLITARAERGFRPYYLAALPGYGIAVSVGLALLAEQRLTQTVRLRTAAVIAVIALVGATTFSAVVGSSHVLTVVDVPAPTDQIIFVDQVATAATPADCRMNGVALNSPIDQIADVWTVIVGLDQRGLPVTVSRDLEPFVGPGHHRTGSEAVVVNMPTLAQFHTRVVPPGAITVRGCR